MKRMTLLSLAFAAPLCLLAPAAGIATAAKPVVAAPGAKSAVPLKPAEVMALAERVGDWQLAQMAAGLKPNGVKNYPDPQGWEQGALFVGFRALADHSPRPEFKTVILARGEANEWKVGRRPFHADDFTIGTSYFWAATHGAGDKAITPMRASLDYILANKPTVDLTFAESAGEPTCQTRWCWADAVFMAPPVWLEMAKVTGEAKYADYAKSEFWATTEKLYDQENHLYFRDSRFFDRRDANGKKVFWSRGDGWVFAGLARMIALLPESDPDRAKIIAVYREMAAELKSIQKPDGYWSPSLLGDPATSLPESSGTGFYTYGFAWGVRTGVLDRAEYEPVVRKGWGALVRSVHPDGKLGYVQPVSDRPDNVDYENTQLYGVGAFLLAATEIADLNLAPNQAKTISTKQIKAKKKG